jgi:hypothetical protein
MLAKQPIYRNADQTKHNSFLVVCGIYQLRSEQLQLSTVLNML